MGGIISCIDEVPSLQRLQYDMTPVKNKSVPILWITGQPGSGKTTQGQLLTENLGFVDLRVNNIIIEESANDTDRGKIVKEALKKMKKVPDPIVIDLIKEAMIKNSDNNCKGYVINNFPRTSKQAELFIKEIGEVDVIIYLYSDTSLLMERIQEKNPDQYFDDMSKKKIGYQTKLIKESISKFSGKVEKVNTKNSPRDVFGKIEEIINIRLNMKSIITTESDYAQSPMVEA